jgi:hypothetical protein
MFFKRNLVISISWKKECRAFQNSGTLAEVSIPVLQMPPKQLRGKIHSIRFSCRH